MIIKPSVDLHSSQSLASIIDHTLLKPDATEEEILKICQEALEFQFAGVCVNSSYVSLTSKFLRESIGSNQVVSHPKVIAVVGFPLGAMASAAKAFEAQETIRAGAQEIDMVIHLGALKGKDYSLVYQDIRQVVEAAHPFPVKVILETAQLNEDQKVIACALSQAAGAAFVKTSTGFGGGGALVEDIALMRRIVGPKMGIKASGGIRTYEDAKKMIAAGATRLGASSSVSILREAIKYSSASHSEDSADNRIV